MDIRIDSLLDGAGRATGAVEQARRCAGRFSPAARSRGSAIRHSPEGDLEIALDISRHDFAIRVTLEDGKPVGRREKPS